MSAGSANNANTGSLGIQSNTFDIWGVQLEAGSVATAFQTASGSLQGELALCQRYLPAISGSYNQIWGTAYSTTGAQFSIKLPVTARVAPSGFLPSSVSTFNVGNIGFGQAAPSSMTYNTSGPDYASINAIMGSSWFTAGQGAYLQTQPNSLILFTGCEL
jgi:hypothetical protein